MSKLKRKLNFKRILLFLLFPLFFILLNIYAFSNIDFFKKAFAYAESNVSLFTNANKEYSISKIDKNSNYSGIGQERIDNKDGYFTTFTTVDENKKIYLEYKQNGEASWKDNPYWENTMETDGCGITAMSIILSGYGKNLTPEDLRENYYPVLKADNISSELANSFGISNSNFFYDSVHLGNDYIEEYLQTNRPILLCVWNRPRSNRWTTDSHYMCLLATDGNGMVYVSNPNRIR